jgi:lysophospholipase L1-like esterase
MNKLRRVKLSLHCFLINFIVVVSLTACIFPQSRPITASGVPTMLISRNMPAFASSGTASDANDSSFDTAWWSNGVPAWLAYNLSSVPAAMREKVVLVWYNETNSYDHTVINESAYNIPGSYTIDINFAPGGASPPTSDWKTVVSVTNNHYHSRQHVFDMQRANWVRLYVTVSDGSTENYSARLNMDIYNAQYGLNDDFIDYGDSITGSMSHVTQGGVPAFADMIHTRLADHFPIQENGSIGYLSSSAPIDPAHQYLQTWLSIFPGKYVGLSYGTNDSYGCVNPNGIADKVYNNYVLMVKMVIAVGKVPIVPHMIWSPRPDLRVCAIAINAKLDQLYKAYSQIIPGPDLFAVFQNHPEDFADQIHPNSQGAGLYRQAWAKKFLSTIYRISG